MICDVIKELREKAGYSQSELAKKLDVSRSAVNAWEMSLSMPTTQYVVELAKLFHVSIDYLLEKETKMQISLEGYSEQEIKLIYDLLKYFDENPKNNKIV